LETWMTEDAYWVPQNFGGEVGGNQVGQKMG
jgi:hypothetical protein